MNKMDHVSLFARDCCLDIFAICETWLVHNKESSFVSGNGYVVVRRDTHGTIRKHGVCLYEGVSFQCEEINFMLQNIVAVRLLDWNLWILAVYRPPSYGQAENTALIEAIWISVRVEKLSF